VAVSLCPLGSARAQSEEEPADDASPDDAAREEQARAVFQAGRVAYENGDFEAALGHFRAAVELSDRPALWFNVGMAATQLRRDAEALEAFETFLRREPDAANAGQVRARVALLRASIARASEGDAGAISSRPPSRSASRAPGWWPSRCSEAWRWPSGTPSRRPAARPAAAPTSRCRR
jgi:tetratricopeptide (TPR) repeat protein